MRNGGKFGRKLSGGCGNSLTACAAESFVSRLHCSERRAVYATTLLSAAIILIALTGNLSTLSGRTCCFQREGTLAFLNVILCKAGFLRSRQSSGTERGFMSGRVDKVFRLGEGFFQFV